MKNVKITFIIFLLVAAAQLIVPASMIVSSQQTLAQGETYKFRTQPIDPTDPFRGKYVYLDFKENTYTVSDATQYKSNQTIYLSLQNNAEGYAQIQSLSKQPPTHSNYLKAQVAYTNNKNQVYIKYPFSKYYMEESKALPAEQAYNATRLDSTQIAYALVSVKNGNARIKNVYINNKTLKEIAEEYRLTNSTTSH